MSWIAPSAAPVAAIAAMIAIVALVLIGALRLAARQLELFRDAWRSYASSRGFR